MRSILALCLFAACSSPSKADGPVAAQPTSKLNNAGNTAFDNAPVAPPVPAPPPPPAPKNLVCEAFKGVNDKAGCAPYFTDSGERHAHTAMVTLGQQQFHCAYNNELLSVTCAEPIVIRQQPVAPIEDKKPKAKK